MDLAAERERRRARPCADVAEAIGRARALAQENGAPLTLERVAACMNLAPHELAALGRGEAPVPGGWHPSRREADLLRGVYRECNAVLAEHCLAAKGASSGALFLMKNDFGYADRPDPCVGASVVFVGEIQE